VVAIVADNSLARGFGPEEPIGTAALARPGRGRFNLTVYHAQYRDGELDTPEGRSPVDGSDLVDVRGGCVSFGQTRNYSVTSAGAGDNNLYLVLEGAHASEP